MAERTQLALRRMPHDALYEFPTGTSVALTSIALIACVALIVLTTVLRGAAKTVLHEFHYARALDRVREDPFAYGRASDRDLPCSPSIIGHETASSAVNGRARNPVSRHHRE